MSSEPERKQARPGPLTAFPPVPMIDESQLEDSPDELGAWHQLQSGATTPNVSEAMATMKRTLSFATLQEMSNTPPEELRRKIQSKLWRPKDEEARVPHDWERLFVHCVRGSSRAFMLAYGLRSTVTFLFGLVKALRKRRAVTVDLVREAFVGEDTVRFALMFGIWSGLYKFINNALRLLTPYDKSKAKALERSRPSSMEDDDAIMMGGGKHRKADKSDRARAKISAANRSSRVRYWHPYVSGAISSVAMLVEKKSLIQSFGPQLFVRGLEGSYRFAQSLGYLNVPYGSVLVFGLANGMIMYSWLCAPRYLPVSYHKWITNASSIPVPVLNTLESSVRGLGPDPWELERAFGGQLPGPISTNPLKYPDMPPTKHFKRGIAGSTIANMYRWIEHGDPNDLPTCALSHAETSSHARVFLHTLFDRGKWIFPVYLTLYVVPTLFLRPKTLLKNPKAGILRILLGATRSSAFLGMYVALARLAFCGVDGGSDFFRYNRYVRTIPGAFTLSRTLHKPMMFAAPGLLSCLSLFVEQKHRRSELSAYVLPKALQGFWKMGREYGVLPGVPYGNFFLTMASLSLIMGTYTHHPESLSRLVSLLIYQFLGRN